MSAGRLVHAHSTEIEIFTFLSLSPSRSRSTDHWPKGNGRLSMVDDAEERRVGLFDLELCVNLAMEDLINDRTRRTLRFGV